MRKRLLAVMLGVFSVTASAEWVPVASNAKSDVYFDAATKVRDAEGKGKVLTLWNNKVTEAKPSPTTVQSYTQLLAFNCERETSQILSATLFNGPSATGAVLHKQTEPQSARYVQPDSFTRQLLTKFCAP